MTEVFKFGGASVKDAAGVKNLCKIVRDLQPEQLLIVVSAMGKTTNKLEELAHAYAEQAETLQEIFSSVKAYHQQILEELFEDKNHPVFNEVANTFVEIDWIIEDDPQDDYAFIYDQIVSIGELVSSKIVSAYLNYSGINNKWLDARNFIQTDNTYREAQVDWQKTQTLIQKNLVLALQQNIGVTQGFIGNTSENFTTTLGREGSDYSAAIFATCLNAKAVTIWKDVPGVLNADPKLFSDTRKYNQLSYSEALEMTYYGATVIHPKTIKPLKNAGIPLMVKPFLAPMEAGTIISETAEITADTPAIIIKNKQFLISLATRDFSFITENHLSQLFKIFAEERIKINMLQISAISFSACFDEDDVRFEKLQNRLRQEYNMRYNTNLRLITVRHFKKELIDSFVKGKTVLLEQFSRNTAQIVLKEES